MRTGAHSFRKPVHISTVICQAMDHIARARQRLTEAKAAEGEAGGSVRGDLTPVERMFDILWADAGDVEPMRIRENLR